MEWQADKVLTSIERRLRERIEAAAIHLKNQIRTNISVPSRSVSLTIGRKGQVKKTLGPRGDSRSKPGEFPHKDFGNLRQSIAYEMDDDRPLARVGTVIGYAKPLEFGASKMRARPFLRRTLAEEKETIRQIIELGGSTDITVD